MPPPLTRLVSSKVKLKVEYLLIHNHKNQHEQLPIGKKATAKIHNSVYGEDLNTHDPMPPEERDLGTPTCHKCLYLPALYLPQQIFYYAYIFNVGTVSLTEKPRFLSILVIDGPDLLPLCRFLFSCPFIRIPKFLLSESSTMPNLFVPCSLVVATDEPPGSPYH